MKKNRRKLRESELREEVTSYLFLSPYLILFTTFIVIPVILALLLSFTNFDTVNFPKFIGLKNYITLLTTDNTFMQYVLPNTIKFSLIVGPVGYFMSFIMAWVLAQIPHKPRTLFALMLYSPTLTSGVAMTVIWRVLFNGDQTGYLNSLLLNIGWIQEPIQWLQSSEWLMPVMIIVSLWNSMGIGFLSMLAGILNINSEMYEAGYIDGISNRFQEIIYITIPSMKPQMLFGAVMAVVNAFNSAGLGVQLSGSNPTPGYAGSVIVNHVDDFGFIRYEMGYAAALSVVLLLIIWFASKLAYRLFGDD
jgi:multiple sugar transport system permease protein